MAQTPSGRLLRRSAHPEDRPAVLAAQFALSHACWLIAYPLAGWAGAAIGLPATAIILALLATGAIAFMAATIFRCRICSRTDPMSAALFVMTFAISRGVPGAGVGFAVVMMAGVALVLAAVALNALMD